MLIGLSAKNSILIVEFAEQLRRKGRTIAEAAIEAAELRLRPILMTSFAFILGVLPLVFATGAGALGRRSVGTTVVGGMLLSTVLNLVFIPVLYVILSRLLRRGDAPPTESELPARRRGSGAFGYGKTGRVGIVALCLGFGHHGVQVARALLGDGHGVDLAAGVVAFLDQLLQIAAGDLRGQLVGDHLAGALLLLHPGGRRAGRSTWGGH